MKEQLYINSIENDHRLSTQELLQLINKKIEDGYRNFKIKACGQHDIGGPLWTNDNQNLTFEIENPGQRVGSMGMKGTTIIVNGSAPADIGWLNAGAEIIVKGDGGDTTSHCAASGKIYIAGRVGTRSGALMKHDPKFPAPEFWVLKNTGSFSFEFMGGGIAVICGLDCENLSSVLGDRSCIGMVGGTIYFRGKVENISSEVLIENLDDSDIEFLKQGLDSFLEKIDLKQEYKTLIDFNKWKKIIPKTFEERKGNNRISIKDFREKQWVQDGIFGDIYQDDLKVNQIVNTAENRLRIPSWNNYKKSAPCEAYCPIGIPTQKRINLLKQGKIKEACDMIFEYTPFPATVCAEVCPQLCMNDCSRKRVDEHINISSLGLMSRDVKFDKFLNIKSEKIAIIGAGVAGLSCAWQLKKLGYVVDVFEADKEIGGKLRQVIPFDRLNQDNLQIELDRLKKSGINFYLNHQVQKEEFEKMKKDYDAIVIAIGAHNPFVIPIEGSEKLIKGLDFLKEVNKGNLVNIGEKVVVIGAGNAAMDVVIGAYKSGAREVTAIDIQKPAAFDKEINHAKSLGAKILWPCFTEKITDDGVVLKDGSLLEANSVIISIGDRPDFSFLDNEYLTENKRFAYNKYLQSERDEKIFIIGDSTKQGLFTHSIADGRNVALNIEKYFNNLPLETIEKEKAVINPREDVKAEYYEVYSPLKVFEQKGYDEDKRCLSCGLCRDCEFCLNACPVQAIEKFTSENGEVIYTSNEQRCIGCGICAGVCPCGIWTMSKNNIYE